MQTLLFEKVAEAEGQELDVERCRIPVVCAFPISHVWPRLNCKKTSLEDKSTFY
jgi:hypothetical protein